LIVFYTHLNILSGKRDFGSLSYHYYISNTAIPTPKTAGYEKSILWAHISRSFSDWNQASPIDRRDVRNVATH